MFLFSLLIVVIGVHEVVELVADDTLLDRALRRVAR